MIIVFKFTRNNNNCHLHVTFPMQTAEQSYNRSFCHQNKKQSWFIDVKEWQTIADFVWNYLPNTTVVGVVINVMSRMSAVKGVILLDTRLP